MSKLLVRDEQKGFQFFLNNGLKFSVFSGNGSYSSPDRFMTNPETPKEEVEIALIRESDGEWMSHYLLENISDDVIAYVPIDQMIYWLNMAKSFSVNEVYEMTPRRRIEMDIKERKKICCDCPHINDCDEEPHFCDLIILGMVDECEDE